MHLHASLQVDSPEKPPLLHRKSLLDLVVTWGDKGTFHSFLIQEGSLLCPRDTAAGPFPVATQ